MIWSVRGILTGGVAVALVGAPLAAQTPLTPKALGMAGAYHGIARGQEALFLNPANLGLSGNPTWSITLPALGFSALTGGPGFDDFYRAATGDRDADAAAAILALVPDGGMSLDLDVRPIAAMQIGPFALGASYGGVAHQTIGRDMVDLMLNGFETGRTDYSVGNTSGWRSTYLDLAAGWAQQEGPVSVGVTAHYLRGRTLSASRLYDPRIDSNGQTIEVDYAEVFANSGSGYSFDVGVAMQPSSNLTLSASIANVQGRMNWSDDLYVRTVTLTEDDFEEDIPGIVDRFSTSERRWDPVADARDAELADIVALGAKLPRVLRAGAAFSLPTYTKVAVGYEDNLSEGQLIGGWDRSVSVGVQQRLFILTARAGYTTNLDGHRMIAGGVSLGPLDVGLAHRDGTVDDVRNSGLIGTVGIGFRGGILK